MIENIKVFVNANKATLTKVAAAVVGAAIGVAVVVVLIQNAEDLEAEAALLETGEGPAVEIEE